MHIIKRHITKIIIFQLLLSCSIAHASQFEELDKPPEGAHEGQIFLSGFVSLGLPSGSMIDEEKNFVSGNTYTHSNGTIKELLITHLSYELGINFEYMPISHIGLKSKVKKLTLVQRTQFGSDYQNWNEVLYSNYSLLIGPSLHLTDRKSWDIVFTPLIGYSIGEYNATPIANELIDTYSGENRKRSVNSICYGAEINAVSYFSGGFFFSIGLEYINYNLNFDSEFNLNQNGNIFMDGQTSGNISTISITISAGYAFSH